MTSWHRSAWPLTERQATDLRRLLGDWGLLAAAAALHRRTHQKHLPQ
jgi:hypothetical protein